MEIKYIVESDAEGIGDMCTLIISDVDSPPQATEELENIAKAAAEDYLTQYGDVWGMYDEGFIIHLSHGDKIACLGRTS